MADKRATKLRRRENKELREREKAERVGDSPAQKSEEIRRRNTPDPTGKARRDGIDGSAAATPGNRTVGALSLIATA